MNCKGCGNNNAYRITKRLNFEVCDVCGDTGSFYVPDVFVSGKPEDTLPDDPLTGKPPVFTSRLQKEKFLRDHHLVEAFGKEHGGPAIPPARPPYDEAKSRHETMQALAHVRQMGRDRRRQEYMRILKENNRA